MELPEGLCGDSRIQPVGQAVVRVYNNTINLQ